MKIAIISGSVRRERNSFNVALYLEEMLVKKGLQIDLIDFNECPLPIYEDLNPPERETETQIQEISFRLQQALAMIFVSPEYHGSYSGVFKNAMDYFWEEFYRKPIGVVTASTGSMGGINASTQLQQLILSLGGYPMPVKLLASKVDKLFDENLDPVDEQFIVRTEKFLSEFLWFADALNTKKKNTEALIAVK